MSARVARLERAVGARLVERTTRRVDLTENGDAFVAAATLALQVLEDALCD